MTKMLSLLLMLGAGLAAHAQIKKGAVLLGGQLSYARITNTNPSSTGPEQINKVGNFLVSAGITVKENAVFGLITSYGASNSKYQYQGGSTISTRKQKRSSAGVFYRKYKQLFKDLYFFGEGTVLYTSSSQKETSFTGASAYNYIERGGQVNLTPGISYNITRKLQATLSIPSLFAANYSHTNNDQDQFSIFTGLQNTSLGNLGVGFHVIL